MATTCPAQSFRYNGTLCGCFPGRYMPPETGTCLFLEEGEWRAGSSSSAVGSIPRPGALLGEVLPLDSVEKVVRSEAVVVKATLILVLFWLAFCVGMRFGRVDGGRTVWSKVRWWIGRLDLRFSTKHQLVRNRFFLF